MDFVRQDRGNGGMFENLPADTVKEHRRLKISSRLSRAKLVVLASVSVLVLAGGAGLYWRLFMQQPAVVNPFSTGVIAAMKFPLYYPTNLPSGYRIDKNSVTQPSEGVVVFDLIGPKGQKLYMSEEARPVSFDLGGFYKKFQDLKEIPVSDGSIAVGRVGGGQTEVVSRANNKTWVLSNTNANIPLDQLVTLLKSLTLSV